MNDKKSLSIRTKLMAVTIPIVLLMVVIFFILSRNMLVHSFQNELEAIADGYTGEVSAWVNRIFSELDIYKAAIEEDNFIGDRAILRYMEKTVDKCADYPVGLYMGDDRGTYLDGSGWVPGPDWVLTQRDWYLDGVENDQFAFGEPYYDSMTGDMCVSASVRVKYEPAVRVLAADIYLDHMKEVVKNIESEGNVKGLQEFTEWSSLSS